MSLKSKLIQLIGFNPIAPVISGNYERRRALYKAATDERKAEIELAKQQKANKAPGSVRNEST